MAHTDMLKLMHTEIYRGYYQVTHIYRIYVLRFIITSKFEWQMS